MMKVRLIALERLRHSPAMQEAYALFNPGPGERLPLPMDQQKLAEERAALLSEVEEMPSLVLNKSGYLVGPTAVNIPGVEGVFSLGYYLYLCLLADVKELPFERSLVEEEPPKPAKKRARSAIDEFNDAIVNAMLEREANPGPRVGERVVRNVRPPRW